MEAKIQKWGNSNGIRLPKVMLEMVGLKENDNVNIEIINGNLVIIPKKKHKTLEERIAEFEEKYNFNKQNTEKVNGKEVLK